MKEIEDLRTKFSIRWNEFLNSSGAIVLVNPNIKSCIIGFFFRMACELREQDLRTASLEISPPKIIFEQDYMITREAKNYISQVDSFLIFANSITEEASSLFNRFIPQYDSAKLRIKEYKTEELSPEDKNKVLTKLNRKLEILESAHETIYLIHNIVTKKEDDLFAMQEELHCPEFIETLVKIEKENHENKKDDPLYLMYKYTKEEKVESISEARARLLESKKNFQEIEKISTLNTN